MARSCILLVVMVSVSVMLPLPAAGVGGSSRHNYLAALEKSILFFEGQRSGKLPSDQRMRWRRDSALLDGHQIGVDLTGGYYDAGDNVKFGFPMAFSATVLAWSVVEFGDYMGPQLNNAKKAVRWATDYLLKATNEPNKIHVQVGDPYSDHNCWVRPEDMDTFRTVYSVDPQRPGSEVAAEMAAALAAASIVFRSSDPGYSAKLLERSMVVFQFADKYRGSYSHSLGRWVCPFYCDFSGYEDELIWAAAWIHKASNETYYWDYAVNNLHQWDQIGAAGEFGWDDKRAGIYVLISNKLLTMEDPIKDSYLKKADEFVCTVLPESPTRRVNYSPGGLLFKPGGSNMQHPTALSLLLVVYASYLKRPNRFVSCSGSTFPPSRLVEIAKGQADYILGSNPLKMSYMIGYGNEFPQRIHHRGSSLPSIQKHPAKIRCKDGTPYFMSPHPNPNLLIGAIVGGPANITDIYHDSRPMFVESEPTTYINAPMVGVFAYLAAHG